jgi:hypothetical protein
MSKLGWVALATLSMIASAQRAEACSCATEIEIVHPSTTSIATWDGLVGRNVFRGSPTLSVTYVDDPAQEPIAGTLTNLSDSDVVALWSFVPNAPLTAGRTIRAVVGGSNGFGAPRSFDFAVTNAAVGAVPSFPGVTTMTAVVSHFHGSAGGSCRPSTTEQSRVGFPGLPPPSAEAPIYRYFFYRQGESPPERGTYGVAGHYISTIRCGNPGLLCEPTFGGLVVGETICARVEALDLMGRASGYDSEACATVGEEEVDLVSAGGALVSCGTHVEDGGLPDSGAISADGGVVAPLADAGAAASETSDGCTCVRAPARGLTGGMGVLLVGLVLALRRRRR